MMDYPVLAGCGLTRSDAAKVLPLVLLVCQRGCKRSANPLHIPIKLLTYLVSTVSSHGGSRILNLITRAQNK